jgi:hypothetical protein
MKRVPMRAQRVDEALPGGLTASEYLDEAYRRWLEPHIEWQRRVLAEAGLEEDLSAAGSTAAGQRARAQRDSGREDHDANRD